MGYIGMCGPKVYGFSAVLVINRVSSLAILVINRVWFLRSSLDMGMFSRRNHFFIIIEKTTTTTKALHKLCLRQFSIDLNFGTNYKAGLNQGLI